MANDPGTLPPREELPDRVAAEAGSQHDLETLRELLLAHERQRLDALEERLNDPARYAREVSSVIAEAILLREGKDERLATALQPTVETIVHSSVRKNPDHLVDSIFPLMGPSIRKAVAETFHNMLQGLTKALEMSFSWRGLKWRFEAMRSGKPFAEIVLLHTLVYRVEQVFLIHAETGLLLSHAVADDVEGQDADQVSAMLTAIQSFMDDCFSGPSSDALNTLQMMDRTILVERDAQMVLACAVKGTPPVSLRQTIRDVLELIRIDCAEYLADFDGDTEPFGRIQRFLDDLLVSRYVEEDERIPLLVRLLPLAVVLVMVAVPSFFWYQEHRFDQALTRLHSEPGLVVTGVRGGFLSGWKVMGMRDPESADPADLLVAEGIPREAFTLHLTPFTSLEADMVSSRTIKAFDAPKSVMIDFKDGVLSLSGEANLGWILQAREKALALPGVEAVNTDKIRDPRTDELKLLIGQIEQIRIEFPLGKDVPVGEEHAKLLRAVDYLAQLEKLAESMDLAATLFIYGHADPTGSVKRNYELSEGRAKTLASLLYGRGVSIPIRTYGFGSDYQAQAELEDDPELVKQRSRRIDLKVHLNYIGQAIPSID